MVNGEEGDVSVQAMTWQIGYAPDQALLIKENSGSPGYWTPLGTDTSPYLNIRILSDLPDAVIIVNITFYIKFASEVTVIFTKTENARVSFLTATVSKFSSFFLFN